MEVDRWVYVCVGQDIYRVRRSRKMLEELDAGKQREMIMKTPEEICTFIYPSAPTSNSRERKLITRGYTRSSWLQHDVLAP